MKFTGGLIYLSDRQARGQINLVDTAGIAARRYYTPAMQASVNPAGTFLTMPEGDQFPIRPANP